MSLVNICMKSSALNDIEDLGLNYTLSDDSLNVIVNDIPYEYDHSIIDPDRQFCFKLNINYDDVYNIELLTTEA
jgi:hypothetical protein